MESPQYEGSCPGQMVCLVIQVGYEWYDLIPELMCRPVDDYDVGSLQLLLQKLQSLPVGIQFPFGIDLGIEFGCSREGGYRRIQSIPDDYRKLHFTPV